MRNIFGFKLKKKLKPVDIDISNKIPVPIPKAVEEEEMRISGGFNMNLPGVLGRAYNASGGAQDCDEKGLIETYRDIAGFGDMEKAIDEIVNEAIVVEPERDSIELYLDDLKFSDVVKEKIREEHKNILNLLNFKIYGQDLFREWYIDGRLLLYLVVDEKRMKSGILEIRKVDPRFIRKIVAVEKKTEENNTVTEIVTDEFYQYEPDDGGVSNLGGGNFLTQACVIQPDSIVQSNSGLVDHKNKRILGFLNKAIRPFNQLRMMENAIVIYRISRAPERRVFYIDVGSLPKNKAEEYLNSIMRQHQNKLMYNETTGKSSNDRNQISMQEDYWLPRREGGRGTEISTLPGGNSLDEISDILYFQKKLYESLHVPMGRLDSESSFAIGRSSEISREELKFGKFITKLRNRFSQIFEQLLRVQLILKGIIKEDEWDEIKYQIRFDFIRDTNFIEFKESEVLANRLEMLSNANEYSDKYFSKEWIRKNILKQSEEEIEEIKKEIEAEKKTEPSDEEDD